MKTITRSEVEKAVLAYFKICHKDLVPAEIEAEIEKRMASLKAKEAARKPKKEKRDFLSGYRLKQRHHLVNGHIVPTGE